jgi:hypothetical protein
MLYNERIKKFFCIKCGWNLTTEDQEKLKSKTDDGNNRGSADKPMKREAVKLTTLLLLR